MSFFEKYKKILLILAFLGICLLFGYLLYSLFFKPIVAPPLGEDGAGTSTTGQLPAAGEGAGKNISPENEAEDEFDNTLPINRASEIALGGLTKTTALTDAPSLNPTLSSNGEEIQYYNQADGKFYRVDKNGELIAMTDKVFYNVNNVVWAKSKDKAILEYPDGANILYNFNTNKQITLPAHWKDFDFDPASDNIVMKSMGLDPDNRWLAVASADGSQVKPLEHLGAKDATVYPSWSPNNQIAAMFTESRDFDRQELYFVGLNGENFKSTIINGRGFQSQWSPKGDQLLYSVYSSDNDLKPSLWTVKAEGNAIGDGRKKLNLETWADKCAYANATDLYCAVPETMPEGAGLFPELAEGINDVLYKIDTKTGVKKIIAIPDGNFSIAKIMVSENENYLYFTDKTDQLIHKVKLK